MRLFFYLLDGEKTCFGTVFCVAFFIFLLSVVILIFNLKSDMGIIDKIFKSDAMKRYFKAEFRYLKILFWEFKWSLIIFFSLILISSTLMYLRFDTPLSFMESLNISMHLIFMDQSSNFPKDLVSQLVFLFLPVVGFAVIAEGLIRFMVLLFNKKSRMEVWQMALASTMNNHVVVCGFGKIGYKVGERLRNSGLEIVVIEKDPNNKFLKRITDTQIPIIIGECENRDILKQANVQKASSIVVLTDNDLVNIEVGMMVKEIKPSLRIVIRLFNPELAEFVEKNTGIRSFSTSSLAAPAFASAVFSDNIIHALDIDGTEANMARYKVPDNSPLIGKTIHEIEKKYDITFVLHQNKSKRDVLPAPEIVLAKDDLIIFLSRTETLVELEKLLK